MKDYLPLMQSKNWMAVFDKHRFQTGLLTIVVVTLVILHRELIDNYWVIITVVWTKGCTGDKASGNEGEWDVTVLVKMLVICGGPEMFIMTLSGNEFLFNWNSVGWIREDVESPKASYQCGVPAEPLMVDGTKVVVTAIYLCNDKQLVALTHFDQSI